MTSTQSQVHFQLYPQNAAWNTHSGMPYKLPDRSHGTQLQFNLLSPPKASNLETLFHKPRPIVIEKLTTGVSLRLPVNKGEGKLQAAPDSLPLTSLSSERLAFAVQLAKQDVKKLKRMLSGSSNNVMELLNGRADSGSTQEKVEQQSKQKPRSELRRNNQIKKTVHGQVKDTLTKQKNSHVPGKVLSSKSNQQENTRDENVYELKFYNTDGNAASGDTKEEYQSKEAIEIKRLRKELQQYMKKLDDVISEKATTSQIKRTKAKWKRDLTLEEPQNAARKILRAEEQAARSTRMLYMLQRKVQEIQDDLDKKERNVKHTKKSQSMNRLAAAHRSAVRALQMFVNHAPLYFDISHGLPPMYQELALLIRQLSLLSSQFEVDKDMPEFDIDLLPRTKKLISAWGKDQGGKLEKKKPKTSIAQQAKGPIHEHRRQFLDKNSEWLRQRAKEIGILETKHDSDDEPTPERIATLEAGADAMERAKKTSSFVAQDVECRRPTPHTKSVSSMRQRPKSILLPPQIRKQRQKFDSKRQRTASHSLPSQPMHFADPTVSSLLKKEVKVPRTPPKEMNPYHEVLISPGTPRQRDKELLKQIHINDDRISPRTSEESPKQISRALVYDDDITEREIARQAWLDRERERELQRLENRRRKEEDHLQQLRHDYMQSQRLVEDAEEKIRDKLQPLLQKAEIVAEEEKQREAGYKQSVKRRLAEIASDTAMSKGEILADFILDDILTDTVHELQRIENEEEAEGDAIFLQKQPGLDTVLKRLEEFEEEEEKIRRHWKQLHYSEIDVSHQNDRQNKDTDDIKDPKPILFTAAAGNEYFNHSRKESEQYGGSRIVENQSTRSTDHKERTRGVSLVRQSIPIFIPSEMRGSIMANRTRYDKYLRCTLTERHGTFDPWTFVERISEELLEDLIISVSKEVEGICDDYVEDVYAQEFIKDTG